MAPPWVIYDSIAYYNGNCTNGAEPDIAGIGVVLSFIIGSFLTTTASIFAMYLDHAFNSRGHFRKGAPVRYVRERFLDTEWRKDYAWRPFLDPLIIALGDQQLVTGYAVLLSGWIKVLFKQLVSILVEFQGAHFSLILYICALSSSSHLAGLITLRKYFRRYKLIAKVRLTLVMIFAVFLLSSMIAAMSLPMPQDQRMEEKTGIRTRNQRLAFLVPFFLIFLGFSTALACILYDPKGLGIVRANSMPPFVRRITDPKQASSPITIPARFGFKFLYYLFFNPFVAFAVQILLALLSTILVLTQKFAVPSDTKHFCGLSDTAENVWGFGQTLSIAMLLLPAISAAHTYLEGKQDISQGMFRLKDYKHHHQET